MSKRINPRRRPATQADVERAKKTAQSEAVSYATTIIFTAILDSGLTDAEGLRGIWRRVNDLSDSVALGYVSLSDLRRVLRDEYEVEV